LKHISKWAKEAGKNLVYPEKKAKTDEINRKMGDERRTYK